MRLTDADSIAFVKEPTFLIVGLAFKHIVYQKARSSIQPVLMSIVMPQIMPNIVGILCVVPCMI